MTLQRMMKLPLSLFLIAGLVIGSGNALARPMPDNFADMADKLLPSVVNISTSQEIKPGPEHEAPPMGPEEFQFPPGSPFEEFFKDFFNRRQQDNGPQRAVSLGSGFIIDPDGYIVTNNHVIADAEEITVVLQDDTRLKAKIIGRDPKVDVALLKVDADKKLPALKFGDSDPLRVGEWVLAIGNPFGLGGTVTAGIVSARARDINVGPYDDFIQTDASINRGNSGGPLFNMDGEVVGINTAIFSPTGGSVGIGFAIPANLAQPVLAQLKEFGRTKRGWLGVRIQGVTEEIAESLGLDKTRGALIARVNEGEPADKAGLKSGDIILEFDGKAIPNVRRLQRVVAETPIGKSVKVVVWRDGKKHNADVTLGELEAFEEKAEANGESFSEPGVPEKHTVDSIGTSLAALTPDLRARYELGEEASGVLIVGVKAKSSAAEKGLRPGDLIVEIAQKPVTAPAQVTAMIEESRKGGRKIVLMLVERRGDRRFVGLPLEP